MKNSTMEQTSKLSGKEQNALGREKAIQSVMEKTGWTREYTVAQIKDAK